MQLIAQCSLWEYNHPGSKFFDSMVIDSRIDREELFYHICHELGDLETVEHSSECLHLWFEHFFRRWEVPIRELFNTAEYQYDPMVNVDYQVDRELNRGVVRELGQEIIRGVKEGIKRALQENQKVDEDTTDTKNTDGTLERNSTNTHYVSAFNQITEPDVATFHDQDVLKLNDTTHEDVQGRGTMDRTTDTGRDETEDRTENEDKNTRENENTDTKEGEGVHKKGIDKVTNQSLIEEQRRVVVFNIYNWIVDKVAKEVIVGVW